MKRTGVSVLALTITATTMLSACGGVDRDGSVKNYVKSFADLGVEVDAECVKGVFDQYDDDELKAKSNAELTEEVGVACAGGAAPAEGGEGGSEEEAPEEGG